MLFPLSSTLSSVLGAAAANIIIGSLSLSSPVPKCSFGIIFHCSARLTLLTLVGRTRGRSVQFAIGGHGNRLRVTDEATNSHTSDARHRRRDAREVTALLPAVPPYFGAKTEMGPTSIQISKNYLTLHSKNSFISLQKCSCTLHQGC